jgi:hypothetical protein
LIFDGYFGHRHPFLTAPMQCGWFGITEALRRNLT